MERHSLNCLQILFNNAVECGAPWWTLINQQAISSTLFNAPLPWAHLTLKPACRRLPQMLASPWLPLGLSENPPQDTA